MSYFPILFLVFFLIFLFFFFFFFRFFFCFLFFCFFGGGYFYFSGATTRGLVYRHAGANVASISGDGNAVFNGSVTIGGNAANTSGARMEYNSTTQSIDFVFA